MQHLVRLPVGPGSDLSALKIISIFLSVVVLSWNRSLGHCTHTAAKTTEKMFKKPLFEPLESLVPPCCKMLGPWSESVWAAVMFLVNWYDIKLKSSAEII